MSSYYLRFVGADTLPKSLSKREVEECFGLSIEDIQELRPPRFRGTARLGAAVQLVMLRATGRPLWHLELTQDGQPKHPLYIGYDRQPEPWG